MTKDQVDPSSKVGEYYLPEDSSEQTRLNFQHEMVKFILGGRLCHAPVKKNSENLNVLDIACGTGIWAMQYGEEHPGANITAIDLGMPKPVSHPSNCQFYHGDFEYDPIPGIFPDSFDLVHLGHVVSCFDDTQSVMQKTFEHMTPGGWIEFHDVGLHYTTFDTTVDANTAIERWAKLATAGAQSVGRDLTKTLQYPSWLREVGFVNINETQVGLPSNSWPTDPKSAKVGVMYSQILGKLVDSLTTFLILAGLSTEEAEDLKERAKKDVLDPDVHIVFPFHIIYAQKPYEQT